MKVTARQARAEDIPVLVDLYRKLEIEMIALHSMWPLADGLDEPAPEAFRDALDDPTTLVVLGEIEGYPFGFLHARLQPLLSKAHDELVGSIRLIYVEDAAREVAVGETMRELALSILRDKGITKFDAHVLPGHRMAKNFFEAGGFAARSIIMHHDDARD